MSAHKLVSLFLYHQQCLQLTPQQPNNTDNVCIGTNDPNSLLDVIGMISASSVNASEVISNGILSVSNTIKFGNTWESGVVNKIQSPNDAKAIWWSYDNEPGTQIRDNSRAAIYVNSAERLCVESTGNVGIGTANASSILHVVKSGTANANLDIITLENSVNAADMDGTSTSILFNQWYNAGTPNVVDSGRTVSYTHLTLPTKA